MLCCIAVLALLAITKSTSTLGLSPRVKHESRRALPPHWELSHKAPADAILPLRIGLAQNNIDRIEELLLDVSHPDSPHYSDHWSASKVAETFRPSIETVDTVHGWLTDKGIDGSKIRLSKGGGWIEVDVSVEEAEDLLDTEYHVYNHAITNIKHVACASGYYVPEHVSKHVELIMPSVHFDAALSGRRNEVYPRMKRDEELRRSDLENTFMRESVIDSLGHCDSQITPDCLRALYNFSYVPLATDQNSLGIVEYTPQTYIAADLDMFFRNFSKSQVGERPKLVSIDGGYLQTNMTGMQYNAESALDLQYAMALVGETQPVTLYQVDSDDQSAHGMSFNHFLDALDASYCSSEGDAEESDSNSEVDCGTVTPAWIISTSYNFNEADLTHAYISRQCAEYAKLGLMGVTMLYASGDSGVGGGGGLCLFPNGTESTSPDAKVFNPTFPSTCPFITSVGATQVVAGHKITDPESAAYEVIFTAGGFSNYFAMPDYQKSSVQNFLSRHPPPYPADLWNSTGVSRGFPDISLNGANYVIAVNGQFQRVFGTSASSPALAAMLYAVNDARFAMGKKSIGFINPVIYSAEFEGAFHDIKNGSNPGCGSAGFSAVEGWDPVTGVGTPDFPKVLAKWLALP